MATETQAAVARARTARKYGGADLPASLSGLFAALGALAFIGSLILAGANGLDYQLNLIDIEGEILEASLAGAAVALAVIFVVFVFGGWVAGRMARYDGAMNGMGAGLWLLVLSATFALLGALVGPEYNAFGPVGLPDWFSAIRGEARTTTAIVLMVLFSAAALGGGYLGGRLGEEYNRKVDARLTAASAAQR
jgi:hypothetical protein